MDERFDKINTFYQKLLIEKGFDFFYTNFTIFETEENTLYYRDERKDATKILSDENIRVLTECALIIDKHIYSILYIPNKRK